jgi:hypothetical protein
MTGKEATTILRTDPVAQTLVLRAVADDFVALLPPFVSCFGRTVSPAG